ncbi:integrase core domain protein [Selenomonas sp. oral taxon 138 str. F0429]|nr:integrase core domain protein [Selenomonas sp. oral taxon 138 str. F0429]
MFPIPIRSRPLYPETIPPPVSMSTVTHSSMLAHSRLKENQHIRRLILHIYADYDNCIGAYKMTHILSRDYGISISSARVYRLMRSMTLPKPSTVKPKRTPQKDSGECHDLLRRQFHQSAPNLVWVSDFTYLRVNRTWYFLCIVMDLFSRKIIGWSLSSKHDTALIIAAFHKAYQSRNISYGLIFHSDHGAEYTASSFRKLLDANNIVQSFSKKGCPFDNACCESFFIISSVTIAPPIRHNKVKIVGRTIHPSLPLFFLKDQCLRLRRDRIFLHQIMNNAQSARQLLIRWRRAEGKTNKRILFLAADGKVIRREDTNTTMLCLRLKIRPTASHRQRHPLEEAACIPRMCREDPLKDAIAIL